MKQVKSSRVIAFGGILCGLSLLFMFFTGIFPFAEYALPAISGILLIPLVIEFNKRSAYIAYAAVSILSLFISPLKESAFLFVFLFGYYPILKSSFEKIKSRTVEWTAKIVYFNIVIISAYLLMIYVFGMDQVAADFNSKFKFGIILLLLLGNAAFVLYDMCLTQLIFMYNERIKPRINFIIHNSNRR